MEVIKQAPNLSDPYHTLGLLHEAEENPRKALDFYMIAAHMNPKVELPTTTPSISSELVLPVSFVGFCARVHAHPLQVVAKLDACRTWRFGGGLLACQPKWVLCARQSTACRR